MFTLRSGLGLYTETDLSRTRRLWMLFPARTVTSAPSHPLDVNLHGRGLFRVARVISYMKSLEL